MIIIYVNDTKDQSYYTSRVTYNQGVVTSLVCLEEASNKLILVLISKAMMFRVRFHCLFLYVGLFQRPESKLCVALFYYIHSEFIFFVAGPEDTHTPH